MVFRRLVGDDIAGKHDLFLLFFANFSAGTPPKKSEILQTIRASRVVDFASLHQHMRPPYAVGSDISQFHRLF